MAAKKRFLTVAHLWGAYCIRGRKFEERGDLDYRYTDDFESFLTEADILRKWGQSWKADAEEGQITFARRDMGYARDLDTGIIRKTWLATDRQDPRRTAAPRFSSAAWPPRTTTQGALKTLSRIWRTPF